MTIRPGARVFFESSEMQSAAMGTLNSARAFGYGNGPVARMPEGGTSHGEGIGRMPTAWAMAHTARMTFTMTSERMSVVRSVSVRTRSVSMTNTRTGSRKYARQRPSAPT
ncbi:MAG: hypothetical protein ABIK13_03750 [Patescibacteria group bacterium]